jgi:deazaflavin-dependent oxidoreductase (nitroreductase family)
MPIPIAIASFNKQVTNRVTAPFARHLPGFALVTHRGRTTGRTHRTPVNVFRRDHDDVFVMTYGPDVDWVRNVETAGECDIETRGRTVHLVEPRRFTDLARRAVPAPVRVVLRLIRVDEFLSMQPGEMRSATARKRVAAAPASSSRSPSTGRSSSSPASGRRASPPRRGTSPPNA